MSEEQTNNTTLDLPKASINGSDQSNEADAGLKYLSSISHDIRTPLSSIIGLSEMMLKDKHSGLLGDNIQTIHEAAKSILHLFNRAVDISKIDMAEFELVVTETNTADFLEALDRQIHALLDSLNVSFDMTIDSNLPERLKLDALRLNQVLVSIVSNSVRFTHQGKITLVVSKKTATDMLEFQLTDTGIGISQESLEQITSQFHQHSWLGESDEQIGSGLFINHKIVELMGGQMQISSELDKGTAVDISIPIVDYNIEHEPQDTIVSTTSDLQNIKVLLVEDNVVNQFVATQILEDWDIEVSVAHDGEEALDAIKSKAFDLIVMDILMPVMDGIEATKAIRTDPDYSASANIPIIALSADVFDDTRNNAIAAGVNEFVIKPIDQSELFEAIKRLTSKDSL